MSDIHDMILALDKQQALPGARRCQRDPDHGRLQAHVSASVLMCGVCGYNEPASIPEPKQR